MSFRVRGDQTALSNPVDTVSNREWVIFKTGKDALPLLKCKGAIRLPYCLATGLLKPRPRNVE